MSFNSSEVTVGQTATASQYNNLRDDMIENAGEYITTGGSSSAYTGTIDADATKVAGYKIRIKANHTNAGAATLELTPSGGSSWGAINIVDGEGNSVSSGFIESGIVYELTYESTGDYFQMSKIPSGGASYSTITGTTQTIVAGTTYIANSTSLITFTVPSTASVGDTFTIIGKGTGGFKVALNSGETIYDGRYLSTTGTSGFWRGERSYSSVTMTCITADTDWAVVNKNYGNVDTALGAEDPFTLGYISTTSTVIGSQSDDQRYAGYIENTAGGYIHLHLHTISADDTLRYQRESSPSEQNIPSTSLVGSSTPYGRPVISDGVLYVALYAAGAMNFRSCPVTSDISNSGSWTTITMSGFPGGVMWLVGFDGVNFWFKSSSASTFYLATLSGTTLTYGSTVSITGASGTTGYYSLVNKKGVYLFTNAAGTDGNPKTKFANHAGTVDTTKSWTEPIYAGTAFSAYGGATGPTGVWHIFKVD